MPELERYRFIKRIKPPEDLAAKDDDLIYEALPAIYHYNGAALSKTIAVRSGKRVYETPGHTDGDDEVIHE